MATAFHSSTANGTAGALPSDVHATLYHQGLPVSDLDFQESRYPPALTAPRQQSLQGRRSSSLMDSVSAELPRRSSSSHKKKRLTLQQSRDELQQHPLPDSTSSGPNGYQNGYAQPARTPTEELEKEDTLRRSHSRSQSKASGTVSYAVPSTRRVVERYNLDDEDDAPAASPANQHSSYFSPVAESPVSLRPTPSTSMQQRLQGVSVSSVAAPPGPRHPSLPTTGSNTTSYSSPLAPPNSSPSYDPSRAMPSVSSKPRASAQFPTYITPAALSLVNPVYSPAPPIPKEEVCVECAMRDKDMADVDVTSPGVWERESDALFEELKEREKMEASGGSSSGGHERDPKRPRVKGHKLTEQNLKFWLTMNPKEPQARQQTLETYVKQQRALLEQEAMAHMRAMRESRQLDDRMRESYSQFRRSAYEGSQDDGVRVKSSLSGISGHRRSNSRDITMLENGIIVEHVDVRKEEKEERDRRRKEERRERSRARKSSRASGIDVMSLYSTQSHLPGAAESSIGLMPGMGHSRPASVLTGSPDSPGIPRAFSMASFSDVASMNSASPRRSRFFGFKNLSAGWMSQDSLAPSAMTGGSMVDMHVELQRERDRNAILHSPLPSQSPLVRHSQIWASSNPVAELNESKETFPIHNKPRSKKKALSRFWKMVTGNASKDRSSSNKAPKTMEISEKVSVADDLPLAPPPPLSYLVEHRRSSEHLAANGRTSSNPSLLSINSPKQMLGMSPPTAPSSIVPSPTSMRLSTSDRDLVNERKSGGLPEPEYGVDSTPVDENNKTQTAHLASDAQQNGPSLSGPTEFARPFSAQFTSSRPASVISNRDKSLPPLPGEMQLRPNATPATNRPATLFSFEPHQMPLGSRPELGLEPPRAPFRDAANRRQSFGGMAARPDLGAFPARYNEFGASQGSLGNMLRDPRILAASPTPSKRKSKFGLASLLGRRKSQAFDGNINGASEFAPSVYSEDYGTQMSTQNSARKSLNSRKLDELVQQDRDFVAYRYPSTGVLQ